MTKITRGQFAALERLAERHARHTYLCGFHAIHLGSHSAAHLRKIEGTGFVTIHRQAENCFRYSITNAGIAHVEASKARQTEAAGT